MPRPIKVRIEAEGEEAETLLALAASEGLVLARPGEAADLVAKPASTAAPRLLSRPASLAAPGAQVAQPPRRGFAAEAPAPASLSQRELEVLGFLVDGWSNAEIASALRIGLRTVRFHLEGVYSKLGVARRGEAAREALRLGLVRFDA